MDNPTTTSHDFMSTFLTLGTIAFGAITHWTANGVAAFFTAAAGITAFSYNVVKIYEWFEKRSADRTKQKTP